MAKIQVSYNTISQYIDYLKDAFLISEASRYDVKGKKYISTPKKYYFADVGLRNARLNFRQQEENHIMENILYNELLARGFNVDVGVVEYNRRNEPEGYKREKEGDDPSIDTRAIPLKAYFEYLTPKQLIME